MGNKNAIYDLCLWEMWEHNAPINGVLLWGKPTRDSFRQPWNVRLCSLHARACLLVHIINACLLFTSKPKQFCRTR